VSQRASNSHAVGKHVSARGCRIRTPGASPVGALGARLRRLNVGTWVMAITAWPTAISGSWTVYPWYWVEPPDAYPISIARDRKEISDGSDST
jgi:hypothetical protein